MIMDVQFKESSTTMEVEFSDMQTIGGEGGTGKDGLSAYEVAVKNGFEGSEVEWLKSLKGEKGEKGEPGYTPVKGKDYWTDADKQEMIQSVISALPVYNGEVTDA